MSLMKKLSLYIFLVLMFSFNINASALDFMPANPPVPAEVVYKGVNEEQWKTIDKIGDPLNCRKQVYNFQKLNRNKFFEINENDCINNKDCINEALTKYDQIFLRQGTYRIGVEGIRLKNKILSGYPGEIIIINAQDSPTGVTMNNSILSNLIIQNSGNIGIRIIQNNLIYRIVVGNTGVYSRSSTRGIGFEQDGRYDANGNCVVSAEAYNGFNHASGSGQQCKGCSADGFDVKHNASNATFIDAHGHHNSDHGFDFYAGGDFYSPKGGGEKSIRPVIRVFYSSANKQRNFLRSGGDNGGWKLDGEGQQYDKVFELSRLIYGSVACSNPKTGFTKPGKTKLIFMGNQSRGNKHNAKSGKRHKKTTLKRMGNKKVDDPYILTCKDLKKVKKFRSFDIPIDLK